MFPNPSSLIGEGSEIPQAESVVRSMCARQNQPRYQSSRIVASCLISFAFLVSFVHSREPFRLRSSTSIIAIRIGVSCAYLGPYLMLLLVKRVMERMELVRFLSQVKLAEWESVRFDFHNLTHISIWCCWTDKEYAGVSLDLFNDVVFPGSVLEKLLSGPFAYH
jgi:hypothetical protein